MSASRSHILARAILQLLFAILLSMLLAMLLTGMVILAYGAHYAGRIYEGVSVLNVPIGGLTREEALETLRGELNERGLPYVSLRSGQQEWILSTEELGSFEDLEGAVSQAWNLGRGGGFREDMRTRARLLWWGYNIVPVFSIEPGRALAYLMQIARQSASPVRRSQLWVTGLQARSGESEAGREMDVPATRLAIERQVASSRGQSRWLQHPRWARAWWADDQPQRSSTAEPISVDIVFRSVLPPSVETSQAQDRINTMLAGPLALQCTLADLDGEGRSRDQVRRWVIDQATLSSWITVRNVPSDHGAKVEVGLDQQQVNDYLQRLAAEIARPPRDPRFDYDIERNALTTLHPGQNGYALDVPAAQAALVQTCLSQERLVALPVRLISPSVTRARLEGMLPLQVIGEGESSFAGSTPDRAQNIRLATSRFQGVIVGAQSDFSFLANLGLVTAANGYSESWVIQGDRTVLGPGGGVCQVSTTCFRAAFWAGLPIVERYPHSYRVTWYEPPLGLDAAVFSPIVDMGFRNDTDDPILILTQVDVAHGKLVFRLLSKPTGRKVRMEGPLTSNPVPAGAPVVESDPTLAPGTRVQVDWPHDGLDVTVTRIVEQDGATPSRVKFFSRYEPWPARYRVGPG